MFLLGKNTTWKYYIMILLSFHRKSANDFNGIVIVTNPGINSVKNGDDERDDF